MERCCSRNAAAIGTGESDGKGAEIAPADERPGRRCGARSSWSRDGAPERQSPFPNCAHCRGIRVRRIAAAAAATAQRPRPMHQGVAAAARSHGATRSSRSSNKSRQDAAAAMGRPSQRHRSGLSRRAGIPATRTWRKAPRRREPRANKPSAAGPQQTKPQQGKRADTAAQERHRGDRRRGRSRAAVRRCITAPRRSAAAFDRNFALRSAEPRSRLAGEAERKDPASDDRPRTAAAGSRPPSSGSTSGSGSRASPSRAPGAAAGRQRGKVRLNRAKIEKPAQTVRPDDVLTIVIARQNPGGQGAGGSANAAGRQRRRASSMRIDCRVLRYFRSPAQRQPVRWNALRRERAVRQASAIAG